MMLMALTGTILAFEDQLLRMAIPGLKTPIVKLDAEQQGMVIEAVEARYEPFELLSVKLPYDGMNAYRIYERGRNSFLIDPNTLKPVDDPLAMDMILQVMFDLHHTFALGHWGEEAVALLGLIALFSVISGIYLWWPWRKGFRLKLLRPRNGRSSNLRGAHVTMGILSAPLLVLVIATGVGMMYGNVVRGTLTGVLGGDQPLRPVQATSDRPAQLFTLAGQYLPDARVTLYRPARKAGDPVGLRLQMPEEIHPNGRTTITIGTSGAQAYDATGAGLGHRVADTFYPLHSGKTGGVPYLLLIALSGLAAFYLAGMGLLAYVRRR